MIDKYIGIPSLDKLKLRTWELLLASPKVFLSAFLWEGFGLACGCNMDSSDFYFITGFGSAVGTFFGQIFIGAISQCSQFNLMHEVYQGTIYALPIFLGPGTAWQKIVNDCEDWGFNFNESFCYMWLVSFLILICSLTLLRIVNQLAVKHLKAVHDDIEPFTARFFFDLQVSMSIGFGDAFFMGTVPEQFSHNFLAPAFGVYSNTPALEGMLKAGASTLTGFLIMQAFQNLFIKDSWLDRANKGKDGEASSSSASSNTADIDVCYDYGAGKTPTATATSSSSNISSSNSKSNVVLSEQQNELVKVSSKA